MSSVVVFDTSGNCKYVLNGDASSADLSAEAVAITVDHEVNPNDVWYDFEWRQMKPKTPMSCAVSMNRISNLPAATTVAVGSERLVVTDGHIEFEVTYPQSLTVTLFHPAYLTKTVQVPCEVQG